MTPIVLAPLEPRDVTPAKMAILLAFASQASDAGRSMRAKLRDRLLELTIHQATRQTDYYSAVLGPGEQKFAADQLSDLPLLNRGDLVEAGSSIRSKYADFGFCSYTSGTSEEPLIVYRSRQEQKYLRELFGLLQAEASGDAPLVLSEASAHHGRKLEVPGHGVQFPVSLAGRAGFHVALQLPKSRFLMDGRYRNISMVAGPTNRIRQLTKFLMVHGYDRPPNPVAQVMVSGQYLSRLGRAGLAAFWKDARVMDSYTLTELFGGADQCSSCGCYHFNDFLVPEVVGLDSSSPVRNGRGRLALTALYPFCQMTPLVRYLPGDLVEVTQDLCPTRRESYRFLGRALRCLRVPGGVFVTTADAEEALSGIPEVRRFPDPAPIPDECKFEGVLPVFRFVESPSPELAVELSDPSTVPAQRQEQIIRDVRTCLDEAIPGLAQNSTIVVTLHPPGMLGVERTGRA